MSLPGGLVSEREGESGLWCRAAFAPVERSGMRPGYDCRCSGCMASLGKPMDAAVLREMQRQAGGR